MPKIMNNSIYDTFSEHKVSREAREMKPMSLQNSVNQLPQRLLKDYEVSIHELLLQPDFDNEIIALEAVLFLEILNFLKGIEYNKLQIM
jgi:hypothetical protein